MHSSGNSSKQWSRFAKLLEGQFNVIAVDLYGAGSSPGWSGGELRLEDEVDAIMQRLDSFDEPFHLVGHSYGGAVASRLAVMCPGSVHSLSLFEPVLFHLLNEKAADPAARADFQMMQTSVKQLMWQRQPASAARHFVDYWSGEGAWCNLPEWAQKAMTQRMPKIFLELHTPDHDQLNLSDYRQLNVPTLLLWGEQAPLSTRDIASLLMRSLPNVRGAGLADVGHMGPVTHAGVVNLLIESFLARHSISSQLQLAA